MQNSIKVINLKKSYGTKEAVKNISFEIKENEIIGLLGPNGSGKTTTIGMILGLLKPTSGEVLINGIKIEKNPIEILQKINFISPYIELPKKLTVKQNLIVYGKLYSVKNLNEKIDYLVSKLRLENLLNRVTGELSSGQKNRISLVDKPKILRLGGIERTKINKVLNKNIKYDKTNKKINVPGQSKLHYSHGIPIKLNITKPKTNEAFILIKKR